MNKHVEYYEKCRKIENIPKNYKYSKLNSTAIEFSKQPQEQIEETRHVNPMNRV